MRPAVLLHAHGLHRPKSYRRMQKDVQARTWQLQAAAQCWFSAERPVCSGLLAPAASSGGAGLHSADFATYLRPTDIYPAAKLTVVQSYVYECS